MPVFYDNKKIIPGPFVSIRRENIQTEAGRLRRPIFRIVAKGTLSVHKGSPDEDGDFWTDTGYPPDTTTINVDNRLAIVRDKQGALMDLFKVPGKFFEIQPYDGSFSTKFIPRIVSINFDEGNWFDKCTYTIEMEADFIIFGDLQIPEDLDSSDDFEESWAIDASDEKQRTFKMTHNVSAQFKDRYNIDGGGTLDKRGWEIAKEVVESKMGFSSPIRNNSNTSVDSSYQPYNHVVQEATDITGGKYSIIETWLLYDGGVFFEEYTVSTRTNSLEGSSTVSVDGNIQGLSTQDGFGDRWTNAENGWITIQALIYSRATSLSGVATLVSTPVSYVVGKNQNQGTITYNYEFSNTNGTSIAGVLRETITVQDSFATDIVAKHVCVMRSVGPVLQPVGTQTEKRRTLNIECQVPPALGNPPTYSSAPTVTAIITEYTPTAQYEGPFVDRNEESFSKTSGRYTRTVSWFWV